MDQQKKEGNVLSALSFSEFLGKVFALEQGEANQCFTDLFKVMKRLDAHETKSGMPARFEKALRKTKNERREEKENKMKTLGKDIILGKGQIFAFTQPACSSNIAHKTDIVWRLEGETVSGKEQAQGWLLYEGQSAEMLTSVNTHAGEYVQGTATVTNRGGKPEIRKNAGSIMVVWDPEGEMEFPYPFSAVLYDPVTHGEPKYEDFCPRHWWTEWEGFSIAVAEYIKATGRVDTGINAIKKYSFIGEYLAVIAAELHREGVDVRPLLKGVGLEKIFSKALCLGRRVPAE